MNPIDLLKYVETGGCSAKIPAKELERVLCDFKKTVDPNLLVDIDTHDDAGVYRINDELALIFTTDFFPPVCSDPYEFGQIAATNSISDVYAMGGEPFLALNISMFPKDTIPLEAYADILRGGADKAAEAGVIILGGHTLDDATPKYGLAVIGRVHPQHIITNAGLKPGDHLILTKRVGGGILLAAHRLGMVHEADYAALRASMKQLNAGGARIMQQYGVRGGTDVTGFGLVGHALKMARASHVSLRIDPSCVPLFEGVADAAATGCLPCAAFKNLEYVEQDLRCEANVNYDLKMILCDAQTSGGLLFGADPTQTNEILMALKAAGYEAASVVGEVVQERADAAVVMA